MLRFLILAVLAILPSAVSGIKQFEILNHCPQPLDVYINGQNEGTLQPGRRDPLIRDFDDDWSGLIYSDFHGGSKDGSTGTARAGFFGPRSSYYIVRDPSWLNVGIGIEVVVDNPPSNYNPLCPSVNCVGLNCPEVFTAPPSSSVPTKSPILSCSLPHTYRITFCPDGALPRNQIGPGGIYNVRSTSKCLDGRPDRSLANGNPVQIRDCHFGPGQTWEIWRNGQIRLSFTNFCLDAGIELVNGAGVKMWECVDALPAQHWIYSNTTDRTIRLANTNLCLDLTDGSLTDGNRLQTWECSQRNDNQIWLSPQEWEK
ncbi:hypothetical protein FA15DRAFT_695809 [Coprinopsis marcescibilis]|uniref:Ricin B lectin domain-containing protein n=1 Tax=Coprinopsis marcescibilis TaxID=230819 RepID=A0A5C3KP39_COPMA|nr:hypothetical protein FA15DRAFT_695809 [Coprinopsis marcescibilis]